MKPILVVAALGACTGSNGSEVYGQAAAAVEGAAIAKPTFEMLKDERGKVTLVLEKAGAPVTKVEPQYLSLKVDLRDGPGDEANLLCHGGESARTIDPVTGVLGFEFALSGAGYKPCELIEYTGKVDVRLYLEVVGRTNVNFTSTIAIAKLAVPDQRKPLLPALDADLAALAGATFDGELPACTAKLLGKARFRMLGSEQATVGQWADPGPWAFLWSSEVQELSSYRQRRGPLDPALWHKRLRDTPGLLVYVADKAALPKRTPNGFDPGIFVGRAVLVGWDGVARCAVPLAVTSSKTVSYTHRTETRGTDVRSSDDADRMLLDDFRDQFAIELTRALKDARIAAYRPDRPAVGGP